MTILGFNPSHHSSVCLLEDGEIKYFIQEERLTREKYDGYPFKTFIEVLQNNSNIDYLTWGTPSIEYPLTKKYHFYPYWLMLAKKYSSEIKPLDFSPEAHHVVHVSHTFYNSGFKEAIGVVIDGAGSGFRDWGQETESIFKCSYPSNFEVLYKNLFSSVPLANTYNFKNLNATHNLSLSIVYETITMHLGWSRDEAGKTMGLAPYGKPNSKFPQFFNNYTGNPEMFLVDFKKNRDLNPLQTTVFIDEEKNPQLKLPRDPKEWHYDKSKITDLEKDLAWKVQNDTQQLVGDYIEKAIKETGLKKVCCAGGYFLNCVTNYYLLKRFPNIEFYFEPISNDSGTAIGAAKLVWHKETGDTTIRPFKSLYLGKQYSKEELLEGIKKYT